MSTETTALQTVRYEVDSDGFALITINRPDKHNALNHQVLTELDRCIRQARSGRGGQGRDHHRRR